MAKVDGAEGCRGALVVGVMVARGAGAPERERDRRYSSSAAVMPARKLPLADLNYLAYVPRSESTHPPQGYIATGSWVKRAYILLPAFRYALVFVGILTSLSRKPLHTGFKRETMLFAEVRRARVILHHAMIGHVARLSSTCHASQVGGIALAIAAVVTIICRLLADSHVAARALSTLTLLAAAVAMPYALRCGPYDRGDDGITRSLWSL